MTGCRTFFGKRPLLRRTPLLALAAGALLLVADPRIALAEDLTAAANAYYKAQQAELAGRPAAAAELYELADSLAPTPEALRSALRTRRAADQLATAAMHAEALLERYPDDERSTNLARETLEKAKESLARYEISCTPEPCGLIVDRSAAGPAVSREHVIFLESGDHQIGASFSTGMSDPRTVTVVAGEPEALSFEAPPESAVADAQEDPSATATSTTASSGDAIGMDGGSTEGGGLSPWYFVAAATVTAGLGAATVWSGLDVLSAHDEYEQNQTQSAYEDGKDRELRTNILIGATSAVGVSTIVLAFFTDFGGGDDSAKVSPTSTISASVAPTAGGAALTIGGSYW